MKFTLFLFVLLPLAYCASIEEKRFIDPLAHLREGVSKLKALLGPDSTEADCEQECLHLEGSAGQLLCRLICQSLLSEIQQ